LARFSATLNGTINPQGKATSYQFEYGATASFGSVAPASPKSIGSGSSGVKVSEALSGLAAGTTYYYRVVASTESGKVNGETRHFTTPPAAGAGAKWHVDEKTLAEAGIEKAFFNPEGTWTIEFPGLNAVINCTATPVSTSVSGTNTVEETLTLYCQLASNPPSAPTNRSPSGCRERSPAGSLPRPADSR
jgi:hypothetical protein